MRNTPLMLVGLTLLAGCAAPQSTTRQSSPPATAATPAAAETWFALGTEPFWAVEIAPTTIRFNRVDGRAITVVNPGARPSFNGERYVTDRITVDVTHAACNDGMSDRRYADTVQVEVGGETLRGCGGRVLPPTHLDGTSWRIIGIDGVSLPQSERTAELRFSGDRVSASVGCNRLNGRFTSDGTRLSVTQLAGTRMACAPELMTVERRLSTLLGQSLALRVEGRGRMILTGNDDAAIVLEPII